MKSYFSIGELSKLQNISRQTLIYYDHIGLFSPAWVDPDNGYRYYSAAQLDSLDTILIMKRLGFSLEQIRDYMAGYTLQRSLQALREQMEVVDRQIRELELVRSRMAHRCGQLERSLAVKDRGEEVTVEDVQEQTVLLQKVDPPNTLDQVSLATKQCFVRAFREGLPVFYQSGAVLPLESLFRGDYTANSHVFLPIEGCAGAADVAVLPAGRCVCTHHIGDYPSIGRSYRRLLSYCKEHRLQLLSDAYELAINDYLSTGDQAEYITKIFLYIK